ncbi:dihydropteroate synthase [Abyssibacter sp.]|uniref:dihydropteroate synthase n=1 Tax=Abyssibacter sp. TaxID=2320200 RepID=UPI003518ED54
MLSRSVTIMGIVNVTPDSFSDGGRFLDPQSAIAQARSLAAAGATVIDVGGESTRPGATQVGAQQELDRVIPVIEAISDELDITISVDTRKAVVMREAVAAGAHWINDVEALQGEGALGTASALQVPVCLMHMQGTPGSMQDAPQYRDVVTEVEAFLLERVRVCEAAGIRRERILLDPGFGFGKTLTHNVALFRALPRLAALGFPLLVGVSRKRMLGELLQAGAASPAGRVTAGAVAAVLAVQSGARIIRTHDVEETVQALQILQALASDQ